MKLFVANIARECSEEELKSEFIKCGGVLSLKIILDRETKVSRGFGFVEMDSADSGNKAIETLNGTEVCGRALVVNQSRT